MASIKFLTRGNNNPATIYIRFTANRRTDFKRSTPFVVNPDYFNNDTGKVRRIAEFKDKDKLQAQLNKLESYILSNYLKDTDQKKIINSNWFKDQLNIYFNVIDNNDLSYLINYCDFYIDKLKYKRNDQTGQIGRSKGTITKYTTIKSKLIEFENHSNKKYQITDVDNKFRDEFLKFMIDVDKLARNTAGRYIKFLKTICLDARNTGQKVSPELNNIKGFSVKVDKIILTESELEQIQKTQFENETLKTARDWLIIGCYIGQRGGDLLSLTSDNLTSYGNLDFIELRQQKTQKQVTILINLKVKDILNSRGGQFPPTFSNNLQSSLTLFNRHIKDVALKSKIVEPTKGGKINPDTNRKETGIYPKWELITSHICRRSFATNFYGNIPTPLLMNVTGHSTEKEFLNYIGKSSLDQSKELAKYWNIESQKQSIKQGKQETPLKAVN